MSSNRIVELDFLRGVAVSMMIVFHFVWDLRFLGLSEIDPYAGGWGVFQKATAALFLFVVGVTLVAARPKRPADVVPNMLFRGARVFALGVIVSAVTWVFFPSAWIYFGILHLIGVSIVLAIPFIDWKKGNVVLAGGLLALALSINLQSVGVGPLVWLGLSSPSPALDFFPVIPWFGVVLLGVAAGNAWMGNGTPVRRWNPKVGPLARGLEWAGRHAIWVYFVHQPLMLLALFLVSGKSPF